MAKKKETTARSDAFGVFKDHETDWVFRRTLEYMNEMAAEIGECLYVARSIDETNGESWRLEWAALADRVKAFADEALEVGHVISARECFMRACNYYGTAEYGTLPTHPSFHELWKKSVDCFHKGAALFSPPVQFVNIQFEDKILPGYFWRPQDDHQPRPTLIAAGGNDSALEEIFWFVGPAAVRRGYNFFTFEHPGHRGAVHLYNDCIKRHDYEVPYKAAIDLLETLPGVDERLALTGYSFGGYVSSRVAAYEERIKAVAPNSPIVDAYEVTVAFWDVEKVLKLFNLIPDSLIKWAFDKSMSKSLLKLALKQYTYWSAGLFPTNMTPAEKFEAGINFQKPFTIRDRLDQFTCPTLAMVSEGDGEVLLKQAKEMIEKIPAKEKHLHYFTLAKDGSNDHCQLDNRVRGNQVMFDWLDELFNYHYEHVSAAVDSRSTLAQFELSLAD